MKEFISRTIALIVSLLFADSVAHATDATWVHFDSTGKLAYFSDDLGNHFLDYSYAGYQSGGVALPTGLTVQTNLSPRSGDDGAAIQNAINYVGGLPADANGIRGVVQLSAGTYDIADKLTINKSGVILRGSGNTTNGTMLRFTSTATGGDAITITGSSGASKVSSAGTNIITDTYVPLGATTFHVNSTANLSVGDDIIVRRPWTRSWIDAIGLSGFWSGLGFSDAERKVVAINGNQVTIDIPLPTPIEQKWCTGEVYHYTDTGRTQNSAVENLREISVWGLNTTGNTNGFGWTGVHLAKCKNCWVRDVACDGFGIGMDTAPLDSVKWCTVQDCSYADGVNNGSAGPPAFEIDGAMCLFQRLNGISGHAHLCQTGEEGAGPNVFLYCFATGKSFDGGPHRAWTVSLLTDNEYGQVGNVHITIIGGGGNGWGAGYSLFYNCHVGNYTIQQPPTDHHYNWLVGGTGVNNNPSTNPGTYDHFGSTLAPNSLYLEQLKERLGLQACENIGYTMFTINATPSSRTVGSGSTATYTVNLGDPMTMSNTVALSVSGLPPGATATFSPSAVKGAGSSTLTVSLANTPAGSYTLTINGTSAGLTHSATVSLVVSDFSMAAAPSSQTVTAGNTASYTVTVGSINGFSGTATLGVSGVPAGATANFSATSVVVPGASTLTIATSGSTPAGSYPVIVTGTVGSTVHSATVSLVVNGATGGVNINTNAVYQIQNVASGLVLNNQGSLTNGSKITQWSSASTSQNLQWRFITAANGYYQVNSVKSGKDAVVQNASTAVGAGIIQWTFGAAGNDLWKPTANSDGSVTFVNLKSGLVLGDPGSSTSTSTQMDQETSNGGSNQKWRLLPQ